MMLQIKWFYQKLIKSLIKSQLESESRLPIPEFSGSQCSHPYWSLYGIYYTD